MTKNIIDTERNLARDDGGEVSTALTTYAADISKLHQKAQQHAAMAVQTAMEAGQLLIAVKPEVEYGGWIQFVESTGMGIRTAQGYMKLARNSKALKSATVAHLGVKAALEYLAEPKAEGQPTMTADEVQPPVMGECLEFTCGRYREHVWPYDDNTFHYFYEYAYLDERGDEMGYPMIHTTLKPVSWNEIRDRVGNIKKMKRSDRRLDLAILWRDNCWLGSGMNAEEFAPNNVTDARRAERFNCAETGMPDLEWGGADDWEEMTDPGFKVIGLIFPERKKAPTLDDLAKNIQAREIAIKDAYTRKAYNQCEMVRLYKELQNLLDVCVFQ